MQTSVHAKGDSWFLDVELMPTSRAKRVNGFLKRTDVILGRQKCSFEKELKTRLARLDGEAAKMAARAKELKMEKASLKHNLHIARTESLDTLHWGTAARPGDTTTSGGFVNSRSRDSSARSSPRSSPLSCRKSSLCTAGLRETLLKTNLVKGGEESPKIGQQPHGRSSSLPNIHLRRGGIVSPAMRRKSRRDSFFLETGRAPSLSPSRPVNVSRDRSRDQSEGSSHYGSEVVSRCSSMENLDELPSDSISVEDIPILFEPGETLLKNNDSPVQPERSDRKPLKNSEEARSFHELKIFSKESDGYFRDGPGRLGNQEFMEDTQSPETLAAMFEKLRFCRYLRRPGDKEEKLDIEEIFTKV